MVNKAILTKSLAIITMLAVLIPLAVDTGCFYMSSQGGGCRFVSERSNTSGSCMGQFAGLERNPETGLLFEPEEPQPTQPKDLPPLDIDAQELPFQQTQGGGKGSSGGRGGR